MRELLLRPWRVEWVDVRKGLDLEVRSGEVFGIVGPNGAGKTSLIKILATLVLPTSGTVRVLGWDVTQDSQAVISNMGLVLADERSFYWRLTVRQNLTFFAVLNELPRDVRDERIDELIGIVGVEEWEHRPFRDLSAGIRQRVGLARALLTDPALLLMDEPTSSLDMHASEEFRAWIREELVERRKKTILLVTHSAVEAEELCTRIGLLQGGKLEVLGSPAEVRSRHGGLPLARIMADMMTPVGVSA